jgi:3-methyladenine DNA glycosylase AlkC
MTEATTAYPALKEIFDRKRLRSIASETASISRRFDRDLFLSLATENLDALGIMQRMRQVATSLHAALPGPYTKNVEVLRALAPRINHNFASISLAEYVALYGQDDFDLSMEALRHLTRFGSAEFAIRPFILRDLKRTLAVMMKWARDENEHVRRLASEGCRPRLPWAAQLPALIEDPTPVAQILDRLKADPSLYVRKSVANHLNDITKSHPAWVLDRLAGWPRDNPHTAWIARHALRSLIKQGDAQALSLVGASGKAQVRVDAFSVTPARIALGERITLKTGITSTADEPQRLVIDYAVHYVKKSGTASRKVFKLREVDLPAGAPFELSISQVVRDFTTRKHHAGHHAVDLLVNGERLATSGFDLSM